MFSGSLRVRLTTLFLILFGMALCFFSLVLYENIVVDHEQDLDTALYNYSVDLAQDIELDPFGLNFSAPELITNPTKIFPFAVNNVYITIRRLDGVEIAHSRNLGKNKLPFGPHDHAAISVSKAVFKTIKARDLELPISRNDIDSYRMISSLAPGRLSRDFILQIAVPRNSITQPLKTLRNFLFFGIPLTLILATVLALFMSDRALLPLSQIIDKARSLSPDRLSERVPVPKTKDEVAELAHTLNQLLDRIQRAFDSQERFIADASHELKTPLAILKGELDLMQSRERSPQEMRAFCASATQELDQLAQTVEDLLILARVDAGAASLEKSQLRLDEVLIDVISKIERIARPKNIRIKFDLSDDEASGFQVMGDADLLAVMLKNLIENAIKYSPVDSNVSIKLTSFIHALKISVCDEGPGIPADQTNRVFERFVRLESGQKGAGLGLAIAKKIAELHGGSIQALNRTPDGTRRGAEFLSTIARV